MKIEKISINGIPAIIWGEKSKKAYLYVHGKMSNKESANEFALIAAKKGYQTISFDLPEHGERTDLSYSCNVFHGITDLNHIGDYVFENWDKVSLYGCSIGAFFSLHAYQERYFEHCLFQSPIVNMDYLMEQMFLWFGISKEQLKDQGEIETPIDTMSWAYYSYVKEHPIHRWDSPTHILYGGKDNLQSLAVIEEFKNQFHCKLTIAENSEHPFMEEDDKNIVSDWLEKNIEIKNSELTINQMSQRYSVKRFTEEDISEIYKICVENSIYYNYIKTEPSFEGIKETFLELPPNTTMKDKYFVGFYLGEQLIAIMDLITGYPKDKTAFIGWFMMKKELQGSGVGSFIIEEVISYLKKEQFEQVQLGYIKGNQQSEHFWRKNSFAPNGREKETNEYTIIVMEREI